MRDTVIEKRNLKIRIMTYIGILLLIFTIILGVMDYLKEQESVTVYATIKSIDYSTSGNTGTVYYKVENKTYEQYHYSIKDTSSSVGDKVKLKYNINDPTKLVNNNHLIILCVTGILGFIITIIFIIKYIKLYNYNKNIKLLKKNGICITTNLKEVYINNNGKTNKGVFPYRVRSIYLNPTDNKEYIFDSDDTYNNLNQIVANYNSKTVKVYLDSTNTANYYVDLSTLIPNVDVVDPREFMRQEKEEIKKES